LSHNELDARRLLCPLPVIRAEQHIARLAPGDTLDILCTDPGALYDIPAWCRMHGHEIVMTEQIENGELRVTVRVGAAS
jgi:tRNA 2-thiouridine synthesizing protein A